MFKSGEGREVRVGNKNLRVASILIFKVKRLAENDGRWRLHQGLNPKEKGLHL